MGEGEGEGEAEVVRRDAVDASRGTQDAGLEVDSGGREGAGRQQRLPKDNRVTQSHRIILTPTEGRS